MQGIAKEAGELIKCHGRFADYEHRCIGGGRADAIADLAPGGFRIHDRGSRDLPTVDQHRPGLIGVGLIESPRGATSCILETDEGRVARLRLRTGSYANWPSVAHAAADNLLPDFPLINKSFELCYACTDR